MSEFREKNISCGKADAVCSVGVVYRATWFSRNCITAYMPNAWKKSTPQVNIVQMTKWTCLIIRVCVQINLGVVWIVFNLGCALLEVNKHEPSGILWHSCLPWLLETSDSVQFKRWVLVYKLNYISCTALWASLFKSILLWCWLFVGQDELTAFSKDRSKASHPGNFS